MQNTIHSENLPLPPHIGMLGKTMNLKGGGGGGFGEYDHNAQYIPLRLFQGGTLERACYCVHNGGK